MMMKHNLALHESSGAAVSWETQSFFVSDDPHEHDDHPETCSVIVGLMQEHRRSQRHVGLKMLQIAFLMYRVTTSSSFRPLSEHLIYAFLAEGGARARGPPLGGLPDEARGDASLRHLRQLPRGILISGASGKCKT